MGFADCLRFDGSTVGHVVFLHKVQQAAKVHVAMQNLHSHHTPQHALPFMLVVSCKHDTAFAMITHLLRLEGAICLRVLLHSMRVMLCYLKVWPLAYIHKLTGNRCSKTVTSHTL